MPIQVTFATLHLDPPKKQCLDHLLLIRSLLRVLRRHLLGTLGVSQ
jgi:hypothetical protein